MARAKDIYNIMYYSYDENNKNIKTVEKYTF